MSSPCFATPLADLAVIEISGADAASFLHGQLTHDIAGLTPGQARLSGYCTAKGRLLGSMVVWQAPGTETPTLRALIKADIAEAIVKRLSMFVLRAKAKLSVTQIPVLGVCTDLSTESGQPAASATPANQINAALAGHVAGLPVAPPAFTVVQTEAGDWIAAPRKQASPIRWWLAAAGIIQAGPLSSACAAAWQADDIAAGLPWVQAATQDVFIPQTLNLDLIDGVSFTKGCYPGQEVVARSHYRGTVKRRMACGVVRNAPDIDADALPGTDIFDARRPGNPCGRIVNAARADRDATPGTDAGPVHVLMEVQLADLDTADFRLGDDNGPAIELRSLPYDIVAA